MTMLTMSALLAGCATAPDFPATMPSKTLVLEKSMVGRSVADGVFINALTGGETRFKAEINGSWTNNVLTLVEDFTYTDGTTERKTWRLTKTGEGKYSGTREDVIGEAAVVQDGAAVRLDYEVTLTTGLGGIDVRFRDLMFLNEDGSISNTATVSKLGLRIGRVALTMQPFSK
jgi:hypothetical protein